jgi:hypothetical protein
MDGVIAHVAGGGRGSFNHRFAQPSRDAHPFLNFFYPTDIFPFTDVEQTDAETGQRDGLLTHARQVPKIFYTNSSYEYWGRAASLIHTTPDGRADAPIPDHTRIYSFAGSQHGPAAFPPTRSIGQQQNNPNDFRWAMRALLVAMDGWVRDGTPPPPSVYARISSDILVTPEAVQFPKSELFDSHSQGIPRRLRSAMEIGRGDERASENRKALPDASFAGRSRWQ